MVWLMNGVGRMEPSVSGGAQTVATGVATKYTSSACGRSVHDMRKGRRLCLFCESEDVHLGHLSPIDRAPNVPPCPALAEAPTPHYTTWRQF